MRTMELECLWGDSKLPAGGARKLRAAQASCRRHLRAVFDVCEFLPAISRLLLHIFKIDVTERVTRLHGVWTPVGIGNRKGTAVGIKLLISQQLVKQEALLLLLCLALENERGN